MRKTRVPMTDAEFDIYINSTTDYLLSDSSTEGMQFEDGEEKLFEDGEEMKYEG